MYIFHTCVFIYYMYHLIIIHIMYMHVYIIYIYAYIYTHFSLCIVLYPHGAFPVLITPLPSCRQETVKVAAAAKTKPVPSAAIDTGDGGSGATEDWAATASPCSKLMHYAIRDGPSESAYISISHEHRM
jgi:hypothetical protein